MSDGSLILFAFLTGMVITGLSVSIIEAGLQRPASFSAPLFSTRHPFRSIAMSMFAGPAMLINDANNAYAERKIGRPMQFSCFTTAAFWMLATGIVSIEVIWRLGRIMSF